MSTSDQDSGHGSHPIDSRCSGGLAASLRWRCSRRLRTDCRRAGHGTQPQRRPPRGRGCLRRARAVRGRRDDHRRCPTARWRSGTRSIPADIGTGPRDEYFIRDYVSSSFDALIPPEINPPVRHRCDPGRAGIARRTVPAGALLPRVRQLPGAVDLPDHPPGQLGLRGHLARLPGARPALGPGRAAGGPTRGHRRRRRGDRGRAGGERRRPATCSRDASTRATVYPIGHSAGGGTTLRLLVTTRRDHAASRWRPASA